jgi:hypothetical protein
MGLPAAEKLLGKANDSEAGLCILGMIEEGAIANVVKNATRISLCAQFRIGGCRLTFSKTVGAGGEPGPKRAILRDLTGRAIAGSLSGDAASSG